jgi:hypothetical protein
MEESFMQLDNTPNWNPRRRQRARPPLVLASLFCVIAIASVSVTLLMSAKGKSAVQQGASGVSRSITPHPLAHVPAKPPAGTSLPPIGAHTVVGGNGTPLPTPCPVENSNVAPRVPTGTPKLNLSPTPTPGPGRSVLPICGNGQHAGMHQVCTTFPGTEPTQDQVRQTMYNLAVSTGFYNFSLLEAEGWQESGWTENIQACDGGQGVMQIQPETEPWLNQTYNTSYSAKDLQGNINLGIEMLTWLYNYYIPFCNQGMPTGQTCTWDTVWPGATDGATVRQIVISSYNQGVGNTAQYGIQNWQYVNNVMALRAQFLAAEKS